ncbi:MAG: hem oxygenase [Frankiales bacterium]|nr:hem oxygenase [Frankiales bacterium]
MSAPSRTRRSARPAGSAPDESTARVVPAPASPRSTDRPLWAPPLSDLPLSDLPLSDLLRTETRPAHAAAEQAFALEDRLRDVAAYGALLARLRDVYGPAEAALLGLRGWDRLTPVVDVAARQRAHLLDDDLAALSAHDAALPRPRPVPPVLDSLAAGLGWLYVLEGSALGGRVVAGHARRALGADLPVTFFSGETRHGLRTDWRSLLAALDAFGAAAPPEVRWTVVAAATAAFSAVGGVLDPVGGGP